jgi:hypothetical protein
MDLEDYRQMCWKRLNDCHTYFNWDVDTANAFLDDIIDDMDADGVFPDVMPFIDNLIVNADGGAISKFREGDETDEEVIARLNPRYYNNQFLLAA